MLAGFTRMSVAVVVLLVELTNNISLGLALMFCICVARKVSKSLTSHDFVDQLVVLKGVPFLPGRCPVRLARLEVGVRCGRIPLESALPTWASAEELVSALEANSTMQYLPVVDKTTQQILGLVSRARIENMSEALTEAKGDRQSWQDPGQKASIVREMAEQEGLIDVLHFSELRSHAVQSSALLGSIYPLFARASPCRPWLWRAMRAGLACSIASSW